MITISETEVNLNMFTEYKNIEVEIVTKNQCFQTKAEKVWIDLIEGDTFIIFMDGRYFCGVNGAGDKIYKIENGEKILLN